MIQSKTVSRKKALKIMALSSFSGLFMPSLFAKTGRANASRNAGRYLSFDQIFNPTYPFSLEPLPYAADALEPAIDSRTMEIHHGRHHQGYINNLNAALENHPELQELTLQELVGNLNNHPLEVRTAIRNHGGGHLNHAIFWNTMSPNGGSPSGALADAITEAFGDLNGLKEEFANAAATVFGSGWAWLTADRGGTLGVVRTPNQDNPLADGLIPLTGVDVWEHAYYLNYQNRRGNYVENWWSLIHWDKVQEIYESL